MEENAEICHIYLKKRKKSDRNDEERFQECAGGSPLLWGGVASRAAPVTAGPTAVCAPCSLRTGQTGEIPACGRGRPPITANRCQATPG